jgi:hypothetical protein
VADEMTDESQTEKLFRLRAMVAPGQQTWDLNYHDRRAIEFAMSGFPNPRIVEALEAVLLFYHAGEWTSDLRLRWHNLTAGADCTTKGLCDFIRKRLAEPYADYVESAVTRFVCPQRRDDE